MLGAALTGVGCVLYLVSAENRAEFRVLPSYIHRLRIRAFWRPDMQVLIIGGGKHAGSIADRLLARDEFRTIF